jgi:hypothetical protein
MSLGLFGPASSSVPKVLPYFASFALLSILFRDGSLHFVQFSKKNIKQSINQSELARPNRSDRLRGRTTSVLSQEMETQKFN